MSLIKLQGNASGTGALTIAAPNTNTDRTLTLPDTTGTIVMNEGSGIFKIDSSGNVGIGTNVPAANLEVRSNANSVSFITGGSSADRSLRITSAIAGGANSKLHQISAGSAAETAGVLALATNETERMRIDSSGNVGIGTATPIAKLTVLMDTASLSVGNLSTDVAQIGVSSVSDSIAFGQFVGGGATFDEKARIDSDGNLLVGLSTSSGYRFQAFTGALTAVARFGRTTDATARSAIVLYSENQATGVGSIQVTNTATSYVTSSDYRLKENVQPMTGALDKIAQLNPVTYTWKADGTFGQGFIAHELQAVVPDCVTGEKDAIDEDGNPDYQGVDTSFLVATLVKAIQEQQSLITDLTARLTALEAN